MLKREIKYVDFNDEDKTATHYFNLTRLEALEMEIGADGGSYAEWIREVVDTEDKAGLVKLFKDIVLASYGKRADDGEAFIKTEEDKAYFMQTAAFESLFMELATNEGVAADFVIGILPKDMRQDAAAQLQALKAERTSDSTPPPPAP